MPYPAATLVSRQGKYYVSVTIPNDLRPAFSGEKSTNKRLSTKTSDKDLAALRLHELANQIYDLFDQKKIELAGFCNPYVTKRLNTSSQNSLSNWFKWLLKRIQTADLLIANHFW